MQPQSAHEDGVGSAQSARFLDAPLRPIAGLAGPQLLTLAGGGGILFLCAQIAAHGGGQGVFVLGCFAGIALPSVLFAATMGDHEPHLSYARGFLRRLRRRQTRAPSLLAALGLTSVEVADDGTITLLPSGDKRALLSVEAVNPSGRGPAEVAALVAGMAAYGNALGIRQRAQIIADNRAQDTEAQVADLRRRQPFDPIRRPGYGDRRADWLRRRASAAHAPDVRYYIIVQPRPALALGLEGYLKRRLRGDARHAAGLAASVQQATRALGGAGLAVTRLDGPQTRKVLDSLGLADGAGGYREAWDGWRVGDRLRRTVYARGPRDACHAGWLRPLVALPYRSVTTITLEGCAMVEERGRLARRLRQLAGIGATFVPDAGAMADETKRVYEETGRPGTKIVRCGLYVTVEARTPEERDERAWDALATLDACGCPVGGGLFAQGELMRAAVPLCLPPSVGMWRALSRTVGMLFCFLRANPGHASGMPLGLTADGGEQVNIDLEADDMAVQQVLLVGSPGSGKSVEANVLARQSLLEGNGVVTMESSGSYLGLNREHGGGYYILFAPSLDDPDAPDGSEQEEPAMDVWGLLADLESVERQDAMLALHRDLLRDAQGTQGGELTRWQVAKLTAGIAHVYRTEQQPLERHLATYLSELKVSKDRAREHEDLVLGLADYHGDGKYASLLDRPRTVRWDAPIVGIDTFHCKGVSVKLAATRATIALLDWRARRSAGLRRPDGRLRVETIVLDEGKETIDAAGDALAQLARKSRHPRSFRRVILVTQYLSDVRNSPQAVAFLNSASVILVNKIDDEGAGQDAGPAWLGRSLGLTETETRQVGTLEQERGVRSQALVIVRTQQGRKRTAVTDIECFPEDMETFASHAEERAARHARETAPAAVPASEGVYDGTMAAR